MRFVQSDEPGTSSRGGTVAKTLLWTTGLIGGLLMIAAGVRPWVRRRSIERSWRAQLRLEERERSLHDAILGSTRHMIVATFGPPRTWLGSQRGGAPAPGPSSYWNATTWYYAFDSVTRSAMAIRFDDDRAAEVEFIHVPQEARGILQQP